MILLHKKDKKIPENETDAGFWDMFLKEESEEEISKEIDILSFLPEEMKHDDKETLLEDAKRSAAELRREIMNKKFEEMENSNKEFSEDEETNDEAYPGNMGVIEMTRFYEKATPQEASAMRIIVREQNWENYKKLIKRVLGVELC